MVSCVFPGSFDPVTKGHLDLIARASGLFDRVTVTVMVNICKTGTIPCVKRMELLRKACSPYDNVSVDSWNGLLTDYMRANNESIIIRGLRSAAELDQELGSASANRILYEGAETIFIPCRPEFAGISSSAVREIASFGGDISGFVPDGTAEEIAALCRK